MEKKFSDLQLGQSSLIWGYRGIPKIESVVTASNCKNQKFKIPGRIGPTKLNVLRGDMQVWMSGAQNQNWAYKNQGKSWWVINKGLGRGPTPGRQGSLTLWALHRGWQNRSPLKGREEQKLAFSVKTMCFYKHHWRRTAVDKSTQSCRGESKFEVGRGREGEKISPALNLPEQFALAQNTCTPIIKRGSSCYLELSSAKGN